MIKVMIADDQELIRQSLQIVLSTHEDLKIVDAVENGFAVLESIKKERPDVILMDIRMPEMDGVYCTKASAWMNFIMPFVQFIMVER